MSDTDPNAPTEIIVGVGLAGPGANSDPATKGVLGLVHAAQAAARLIWSQDSLAYRELVDALALAEIGALRLIAEDSHVANC